MSKLVKNNDMLLSGQHYIILNNDNEVNQLPKFEVAGIIRGVAVDSCPIGSEAFCPSTGNVWVLDDNGWQLL